MASHLLSATSRVAYLRIPAEDTGWRAGDSLWPALSPIVLRRNRKYSIADRLAYVGFDVMSKPAPRTPGLSDRVFYGSGTGECWNSH